MALRVLDIEDWLIGVRLQSRDPDTGSLTPVPVSGIDFTIDFVTAGGRAIGAGVVSVADDENGRLFIALAKDARIAPDFGDAQSVAVFGDLLAREVPPSPVEWRSRGRVSLLVFKGY
jgi:hypothetical protein